MILDPLDIPDELLEAQEQGRLVVFAGAGVSRGLPSDLPDFKGLAAEVAKDTPFEKELSIHEHRLDGYFGKLSRGGVDIQHLVRQRIGNPTSLPTDLHRWILELFPDPKDIRIVTTNFDTHFTSILTERKLKCDQYFAPALPLGRRFRGIVYLHGSLLREDDPLILSDEEFGCAYMTDGWARDFLRGMFDTYTTLFIGYSHTDPPVEYLARGMSAHRLPPRYAMVSEGDEDWWHSLKVKPILFKKPGGGADFSQLCRGLNAWAQFSKDQPTDIATKVRNILRSPPQMKPARSQTSLLVRCLSRKDSCHFFTDVADGWHWVEWAKEQGLLKPLFDVATKDLTEPQWRLAAWLAKILIAEPSDAGLLLVSEQGGAVGRDLWLWMYRTLWINDSLDLNSPITQKWICLLVGSCPDQHKAQLGHLLKKVATAAQKTLGLVLFSYLTGVRVKATKGWDFSFEQSSESFTSRPQAELEVELVGEVYHLEQAWEVGFKPHIEHLGGDYLRILTNRLHEIFTFLLAAGKADERRDPWCMRSSIQEREAYREFRDTSLIVDCLLDVVETHSKLNGGLSPDLVDEWLSAGIPTLVRVGLYSLLLSNRYTRKAKVELLSNRGLIYPAVWGADRESKEVLVECYPDLNPEEKGELWKHVERGPQYPARDDVRPEDWRVYCQLQVDKLTHLLATRNKDCPIAAAALKELAAHSPELQAQQALDREVESLGVTESPRSPRTAADMLTQSIDSQIEFLLTFEDETRPPGKRRADLVAEVGDACAQNSQWAISLFEELAKRDAWTSDLWEGAFWRLRLSTLPSEKLTWLLDIFDRHFATSLNLEGLTFFLFNGVEFSERKAPPKETIESLIRLSLRIWNQLKIAEPPKTDDFEKTDWEHAINHSAGRIVEFWLKCWSHLRPQSPDANDGWPEWLRRPLEDMVDGASYAAQLGRVILGYHLLFVHAIDPAWARARLFPKFNFAHAGKEAFLLWEPHLKYGQLSRDLIIEMQPLYKQSFPHLRNVENDLAIGLYRHIAITIYSCLVDVNQDGWLNNFLLGLTEEQRASWAKQMGFVLRDLPGDRKQIVWERWMKEYWQGRLHGKPCKLESKEAGEMLEWALLLESIFPSAVDLVLDGPPVSNRVATVLFHLERGQLLQTQPEAVIQLLKWLLMKSEEEGLFGEDVRSVIMRLPRRKAYVSELEIICDHLARRGYAKAIEMKEEIQREFVEVS